MRVRRGPGGHPEASVDWSRLRKVHALTSSPNEGEAAAARHLLDALLSKAGMSREEFARFLDGKTGPVEIDDGDSAGVAKDDFDTWWSVFRREWAIHEQTVEAAAERWKGREAERRAAERKLKRARRAFLKRAFANARTVHPPRLFERYVVLWGFGRAIALPDPDDPRFRRRAFRVQFAHRPAPDIVPAEFVMSPGYETPFAVSMMGADFEGKAKPRKGGGDHLGEWFIDADYGREAGLF